MRALGLLIGAPSGAIIHADSGSGVAPLGLGEEEEVGAALEFPGLTPRAVRSRPSRASETRSDVSSFSFA